MLKKVTKNILLKSQRLLNSPTCLLHNTKFTLEIKHLFSSDSSPKQQFLKTFLVRIQYNSKSDAYYETYPHRDKFRKEIKKLEDSKKCFIFGGDQFPLQSTQLVFNCDQKSIVQNFLSNVALSQKRTFIV